MRARPSLIAVLGILAVPAALLSPFWLNAGKPAPVRPVFVLPIQRLPGETKGETCIEPTQRMATDHMRLLAAWRDQVVREGRNAYTATDGRVWFASLQNTCLDCHADKAGFCDACHNLHGVKPDCWECHVVPGELSGADDTARTP